MIFYDDALLLFSLWQRQETLKAKRLRLIERWRYRQWLNSFDLEPGKAPYGVYQGP